MQRIQQERNNEIAELQERAWHEGEHGGYNETHHCPQCLISRCKDSLLEILIFHSRIYSFSLLPRACKLIAPLIM